MSAGKGKRTPQRSSADLTVPSPVDDVFRKGIQAAAAVVTPRQSRENATQNEK